MSISLVVVNKDALSKSFDLLTNHIVIGKGIP